MKAGNKAAAPLRDAATIAAAARLWLEPRSPWMARAKRELAAFSPQMIELGLRELFAEIAANVEELERREAPSGPAVPDGHQDGLRVPRGDSFMIGRAGRPAHPVAVRGARPTLCHVLSGNLPNPGVVSIIVGLLSGARNVVKPATGDPMPALFVESLAAVDAKLTARVTLTNDREAYQRADVVVAYGDDETIETLRLNMGGALAPRSHAKTKQGRGAEAPPTFFGFGHRVSIGLVNFSKSAIRNPQSAIRSAARDASMWDQQGCMSSQCFYVRGDAAAFAEALAREMKAFDRRWPRVELGFEDAAAIARARSEWSFRGCVWAGKGSTDWTVALDERSGWAPSPLNRFVFVRPIELLQQGGPRVPRGDSSMIGRAGRTVHPVAVRDARPALSTIGFAGFSLKEAVAMARADRYCSLGEMQRPSLLPTDGSRPRVGDLIHES